MPPDWHIHFLLVTFPYLTVDQTFPWGHDLVTGRDLTESRNLGTLLLWGLHLGLGPER